MDLERFDVAAGATGQWTRIACQSGPEWSRRLLPLSGSLWLTGDSTAPFNARAFDLFTQIGLNLLHFLKLFQFSEI